MTRKARRGFTLTELMIAVLILVIVIVATSKIFGTVSRVTGIGEAGAAVLQEAAAIERQIRSDFERLSREGYFMIRCVAVPNNVNVAAGGPLLNPALRPGDVIRADQLIFFTQGVQSIQTLMAGAGTSHKGQSAVARVYYGHAFQIPSGPPVDLATLPTSVGAFDPKFDPTVAADTPVVPWSRGLHDFVRTVFLSNPDTATTDYVPAAIAQMDVTQPPATHWLLARQAIVLADDADGIPSTFLSDPFGAPGNSDTAGNRSAPSIVHPVIVNGRVDAAGSELHNIRAALLYDELPQPVVDGLVDQTWIDQQGVISSTLFYPRAERVAPGMHRVDQALTNNALASACSSFIVDWTYADGVGRIPNTNHLGVIRRRSHEQTWHGLPDVSRGVMTFADFSPPTGFVDPTVWPVNIEPSPPTPATQVIRDQPSPGNGIAVYEAIFGFNQDVPLDPETGNAWSLSSTTIAYTPWPTSIRITMTLHDPDLRLERGRQVEFVINLPERDR